MKSKSSFFLQFIKDASRPFRHLFLSKGLKLSLKNVFPPEDLEKRVLKYKNSDLDFSARKQHVLYTCITGNYDRLIVPTYYNPAYDYVCFTDNSEWILKKRIGPWQVRPLQYTESSNALNNRWHKVHSHKLFPEYEDSIYIDGNIDILDDNLFRQIGSKSERKILIPKHAYNNCIYKEIKVNIKNKRAPKKQCMKMKKILKESNYPKNYGLCENNVIYRKHNDSLVITVMEEWWKYIKDIVPRDQLSLCFLFYKYGINLNDVYLQNPRLLIDSYHFYYDFFKSH
ncbi:glycosyltransferase domain-containing protein [Treponema berlinense]|uniref:glycosyltransferase domain-containing protein n=1 Tax=Treponema berlinense TaxID=225004 RepID=UPI0026F1DDBD|nr:glycosyltransferase domain-containing protein [Treponema berlinense]